MSSMPQSTEPSLTTFDRRLRARRPLPSLAYIDLGENNGGIILNLSEGGLAITSAAPLDSNVPIRMRFQLPGSTGHLAACGEITWISKSKKEAGLRFVELSEQGRTRIAGWISSEPPPALLNSKTVAVPAGRPTEPLPTYPAKNATPESVAVSEAGHDGVQRAAGATETDTRLPVGEEPSRVSSGQDVVSDSLSVGQPLEPSDRRVDVRRRVPSLAYVDLGQNNGGIILNLSEGGLAIASAAPLYTDGGAQMQFQLPGSDDWLKVSGEIVWISQSKKEAGLRFLELSKATRDRITRWISSQASKVKFEVEEAGSREKAWRHLEMPTIRLPLPSPDPVVSKPGREPRSEARKAAADAVSPSVITPAAWSTDLRLGVPAENFRRKVLLKRTWAALALIVVLGALVSFLAGWFTAAPGSSSKILARFGKTPPNTVETAKNAEAPTTGAVASAHDSSDQNASLPTVQPTEVPASADGDSTNPPVSSAPAGGPTKDLTPPGETTTVGALPRAANPQDQVGKAPSGGAKPSVPVFRRETAQPGLESRPGTTPSPIVSPVQIPRKPTPAGPESSLSAKPAEAPAVLKPSFSVDFNPYPSIRVPAGFKSQQGARLEIGRLLSRVDPVYPEDAETQRVEGTVKLHVIIGLDGSVRSLEPISGPALLIPAAEDAVRQWRYTESSIGDQLVETEEDISITFRLVTQPLNPN